MLSPRKTFRNRFGSVLRVGQTVTVTTARGNTYSDTIRAFETSGAFVRAYGVRALMVCGLSASVDDCVPL